MIRSIRKNMFSVSNLQKIFGEELVSFAKQDTVYKCKNYIDGQWYRSETFEEIIPNPLTGKPMLSLTKPDERILNKITADWLRCPKSGLHNPLKDPQMYRNWGDVFLKSAYLLRDPEIFNFLVQLVRKVMPKSELQAKAEVDITKQFLDNFAGDNTRFSIRGFVVPGDRQGSQSTGYRFPYGPVAIIAPFNFPIEIPVLQLMGSLFTGNKPLIKPDHRTSPVVEAWIRLLMHVGFPLDSLILLNSKGNDAGEYLLKQKELIRLIQFTGSSKVATELMKSFDGKVRIEDSGFNWKILGPDVKEFEYVVSQIDQDAYAASAQKCSATRILLVHRNWISSGVIEAIEKRCKMRILENGTICPLLSVTDNTFTSHVKNLEKISGVEKLWGDCVISRNNVPKEYGLQNPTALKVPLSAYENKSDFKLLTTEIFGPLMQIVEYDDSDIPKIKNIFENINLHLTAGIVSNDVLFVEDILRNTINGVTYGGIRAKTTGAPQNHYFGPGGDPRSSGIGTPDTIVQTWTYHREIIMDFGSLERSNVPLDLS